jgi:hypothetical protein
MPAPEKIPGLRITVQGGISNHLEDSFLFDYFKVDGTGWGTPFLLVPEATTVDSESLKLLCNASEEDVILSNVSPLNIKFSYLKGSSCEVEKNSRIESGKPGGPCTEQVFPINSEFTGRPVCTASSSYQQRKIEQLRSLNLSDEEFQKQSREVLFKECLCVGLSNAAFLAHNMEPIKGNSLSVTICPGPNIAYFSKIATLQEMTDHIYGRSSLLDNSIRPNLFVKELNIYIKYLKEKYNEVSPIKDDKVLKFYTGFCQNLLNGIEYYKGLSTKMVRFPAIEIEQMKTELNKAGNDIMELKQNILKESLINKVD